MKKLLFFGAISMMLTSCGDKSGSRTIKTVSGYEIKFADDVAGEVVKEGEIIHFYLDMHDDKGALVQSYRDNPQMPSTRMPAKTDELLLKNPVLDLLYQCSEGDSVSLFIPIDSMPNPMPNMGESKLVEYRVKIEEIETKEEIAQKETESKAKLANIQTQMDETLKKFNTNKYGADLKEGGGVQYVIHKAGSGDKLVYGDVVKVHYYGALYNGEMFDSSFKTGRSYPVTIDQTSVIQGWHSGLKLLRRGAKATLFIPYAQAYGEAGRPPTIPQKADLAFYVEVE